jgi:hypothetical protein
MKPEFSKGETVEAWHEGARCWTVGEVTAVFRMVEIETKRRFFRYFVDYDAEGGQRGRLELERNLIRRPGTRKHSTRVIRANRVNKTAVRGS